MRTRLRFPLAAALAACSALALSAQSPPTIGAGSATPSSGLGPSTFTLSASDSGGAAALSAIHLLVSWSPGASNACYLMYMPSGGLYLAMNQGGWLGPSAPGTGSPLANGQCTLNAAATTVATAGNTITIQPVLSFDSGFVGNMGVYGYASNVSGQSSGWQQAATYTTVAPGSQLPSVSVTPDTGTGRSQVFTLRAQDVNGWRYVAYQHLLVGPTSATAANACLLMLNSGYGGAIFLMNDAFTEWLGPVFLNTPATLSNGQCTVDSGQSAMTVAGNEWTFHVSVTFSASFAGSQNLYLAAVDQAANGTGWIDGGSWTASLAAVSIGGGSPSPASGTGPATFAVSATGAGLSAVHLLINWAPSGSNSCYMMYQPAGGLYLAMDQGGWLGPSAPGSGPPLANGQCTLDAAQTVVTTVGASVTVKPVITFQPGYVGAMGVYGYAADGAGTGTGWQQVATYSPAPASPQPPSISVTPGAGTGMTQTFTVTAQDVNGWKYVGYQHLAIGTSLSTFSNSCLLMLNAGYGGAIYLMNDGYTEWLGPIQVSAPQPLGNSQCTVNTSPAPVMTGTGTSLAFQVSVTFTVGFAGVRNLYLAAVDVAGGSSGWVTGGTWGVAEGVVATPAFSPGTGTYTSPQTATISSTAGATIRYTTDGTAPSRTNGNTYTAPIAVSASMTVKAFAYRLGWIDSGAGQATYTIATPPVLAITSSHSGNLVQGQSGATYTLTVSNAGSSPTNGTAVTVVESVPAGLIPTSISGSNWNCAQPAGPCTTAAVLAAGASYPALTLAVNVAPNAPASLANQATVSGGGSAAASASDPTVIDALPRYADPIAFTVPASVVGGAPTTLTVTYTSDNGPAGIASGQVKIDNCYLAWDAAGNVRLFGGLNGLPDSTGTLGQAATLWAGNCSIQLANSLLSTPAANPKARVLSLSVVFPERTYPGVDSGDFIGSHEVYAWGTSATGLETGAVDLGALVVSQGQDFSLSLSPGGIVRVAANTTVNLTLTARSVNGFSGSIALTTEILQFSPACFVVVYAPALILTGAQATISVRNSNCWSGTGWLKVSGTGGGITRPATNSNLCLEAAAGGDFNLAVGAPAPAALTPQGSVVYPLTVTSMNGQAGWVTLTLNGIVPAGVNFYITASQVYLSGWGSSQTVYLTFYGSAATPGGTHPLEVAGAMQGLAPRMAGFTLSTQATTFQVTSATGGAIAHNTGQEVQATHAVPAGNAPGYTGCTTPDPDVSCRVVSATAGTVVLGITASPTAAPGTRLMSLNEGAATAHVAVGNGQPQLTYISQPEIVAGGEPKEITVLGDNLEPGYPYVRIQPKLIVRGGLQDPVSWVWPHNFTSSNISATVYPPDGSEGIYDVYADFCDGYFDPRFLDGSGGFPGCVSNSVALAVTAAPPPPQLICTSPVTRGQTATCTVSGVSGNAVSSWSFSRDGALVAGPPGASAWNGTMVAGGVVTVGLTTGAALSAAISVNDRIGFAFTAAQPVQRVNGAVNCGSVPLSVPDDPRLGELDGASCLNQQYLFTVATVSSGPNRGFHYVANISNGARYDWVLNNALNARSGAFWSAQCGNWNGTAGFISGENLRTNVMRHEADTSTQSHWVNYRIAQDSNSNNLGVVAESLTGAGAVEAFTQQVRDTLNDKARITAAAADTEPYSGSHDRHGVFQGYVNVYPYQPCN